MKIKVLFITNILSQHQVGLWDEFCKYQDIKFIYLCTRPNGNETEKRYKINERKYVVNSNSLTDHELKALISSQDYLITGSIEDDRIKKIIHKKANIIWAYEHFSKKNRLRKNFFKAVKDCFAFKKRMQNFVSNVSIDNYLLCMSSHTAKDWKLGGFNNNNIYKFGYFPIIKYATDKDIKLKNKYQIIWSGRFITLKHPETALHILRNLRRYDSRYHLDYFGNGPLLELIKELTLKYKLESCVTFHGEIDSNQMKKEFLNAGISIFSSDYGEGWGSVLGEALASGCIVFADKRAGSTNYLVNNKNGFAYKGKNSLNKQIKKYTKEKDINQIRQNAIKMMNSSYSGTVAAERLHEFVLCLHSKKEFKAYKDGPLSKA